MEDALIGWETLFHQGRGLHATEGDTMKKMLASLAIAGSLMVGVAGTVSADEGGVPNENSCIGREFSRVAQTGTVGSQASALAQNEVGPGISAEVQAFRAAVCP